LPVWDGKETVPRLDKIHLAQISPKSVA